MNSPMSNPVSRPIDPATSPVGERSEFAPFATAMSNTTAPSTILHIRIGRWPIPAAAGLTHPGGRERDLVVVASEIMPQLKQKFAWSGFSLLQCVQNT
jgi:hypothetical protein